MKKLSILLLLATFSCFKISAQSDDKKITDLVFLYADEKYEKLVSKSLALTQNDKYRKHPSPYIYAAMGYYEMSRRPGKYDVGERDSKYKNPLKSAQKYLYKYVKVEKKATKYFPDYEGSPEDYEEISLAIADSSNTLAQQLYLMEKPRKAASIYKYTAKAVPNDPVLVLWQGLSEIKSKNTLEGDKNLIAALKRIDENYKPTKATSPVIAHGMLLAEEYLAKKGDSENAAKARKLVEVFKKYDPDELDKKKMEERKKKAKADDKVMRKFYSDEDDEVNKERKKGNVIIKDSDASKDAEDELDKIEKEAKGGK